MNLALAGVLLVFCSQAAPASQSQTIPYELSLVYIFDATPTEFVFVIGNSGFKTVASLERFIATLPAGTTIRWNPGCERLGGEPLLSSEREMAKFVSFCREHRINFVLVPSG